jgi:hypothetical protein
VFCAVLATLQSARGDEPPAASEDWTRFVPGDVRFYAELRDLNGMRERFVRLGIWQTVRDLAEGRTTPTDTAAPGFTESLLPLSPDEAVSAVLGRRSALLATSSAAWQRGVILADLGSDENAARLLVRLGATQTGATGPVRRHTTRGGILVGQREALLILGPADDPEGLWERTVSLAAGKLAPSLQARSEFASLRGRLAREHDGLVFASWPEDDPYAFAGCQRLIAGFKFEVAGLRAEIHGQRRGDAQSAPAPQPLDVAFIRALPAATLMAWCGPLDSRALAPSATAAPGERRSLWDTFAIMFAAAAAGSGCPDGGTGPARSRAHRDAAALRAARLIRPPGRRRGLRRPGRCGRVGPDRRGHAAARQNSRRSRHAGRGKTGRTVDVHQDRRRA